MPLGIVGAVGATALWLVSSFAGADEDPGGEIRRLAFAGECGNAITAAEAALKQDPSCYAAARLLQDLLYEAHDEAGLRALLAGKGVSPAVSAYLAVRAKPPEDRFASLSAPGPGAGLPDVAVLDRAWAALEIGKARSAIPDVRAYLKAHPDDPEGWEVLGRMEAVETSPRAGRPSLEKALALDPGRPGASRALSDVLQQLGERAAARATLEAALQQYPKNYFLRFALAVDHLRADELDRALVILQELEKERAKDDRVLDRLAFTYRRLGRLDDAATAAGRALELDPKNARALETLGFVQEKKGALDEALRRDLEAVRAAPEWIDAYVAVAFVQVLMGELEYAKATLDKAFDIEKDHPGANRVAGLVAFLQEDDRAAKRYLSIVLASKPNDIPAHRFLGYLYLDEGKANDALDHFQKIAELDVEDSACHRMIGRANLFLGKVDVAIAEIEKAIALAPKDAWAELELGKALETKGDFDGAKAAYQKSIALDPKLTWPHLYLAELFDDTDGDVDSALPHYQRYLELGGPDADNVVASRIAQIRKS